jgi:hypothetical protein
MKDAVLSFLLFALLIVPQEPARNLVPKWYHVTLYDGGFAVQEWRARDYAADICACIYFVDDSEKKWRICGTMTIVEEK